MAIGQVALAWNDLHESIGVLFNEITTIPLDGKIEAAFQAVDSDRTKRKMLKAVVAQLDIKEQARNPRAIEDVKWACNQIDALEEARNNVVHSPLMEFQSVLALATPHGISPNFLFGNARASKLRGKDLLTEYRYVRDATFALRDFIEAIEDAWSWSDEKRHTWPDRPQLPNRGQKSQGLGRRSNRPKQLPLLPEASQE